MHDALNLGISFYHQRLCLLQPLLTGIQDLLVFLCKSVQNLQSLAQRSTGCRSAENLFAQKRTGYTGIACQIVSKTASVASICVLFLRVD